MADSSAWLTQAKSDLEAAQLLKSVGSPSLHCQVTAKCQQVVEKSIKAITVELKKRGVIHVDIAFDHSVERYITAIRLVPRTRKDSVPDHVKQSINRNLDLIRAVMQLAPHRPPNLARLPRNTEYPFHDANGELISPAQDGIFNSDDSNSYFLLACRILRQADTLISVANRGPK